MLVPTFPEFVPLSIEDKDEYNSLVAEYPPLSNISFTSMHIWWNFDNKLALSMLNGNLVIYYHIVYDPKNTGYSVVGKHDVDASVVTLFKYLTAKREPVRVVHVPEFVIDNLTEKEAFTIEEELDYNEYILDSAGLASLEGSSHGRTRRKVRHFKDYIADSTLEIKELDLTTPEAKELVFESILRWEDAHKSDNDPDHTEHQALRNTLKHASALDIKHLGLYLDGELRAVLLYHHSIDKKYYILNHLKVDYTLPYIFDYMVHHIANKALEDNVKFLNMEMDLGLESLRNHKMGLRPVDFFRQYTISPHR